MTAYDIHPSAIQGVVDKTKLLEDDLNESASMMDTARQWLSSDVGSKLVDGAVQNLFGRLTPTITFCHQRTEDARTACINATNDYIAGDHAMMHNATSAATQAPVPAQLPGVKAAK